MLRNIQDLLSDGKTHKKDGLENHSKGQKFLFGAMVEYHPISARDQSRLHQFCKKVLSGICLGCELIAVRIWKGDILIADIEELENMDASEIYPRRSNANFKANRESLNRQNQQMTRKPVPRSTQGDFIYRQHTEPRCQLYVPREETFPIPLKYIGVLIWTSCEKSALMTTGMSIRTELCQVLGKESQKSLQ